MLPWLLRRLRVTVKEARKTRSAAAAALGALGLGAPARDLSSAI